jgi:deoxycytidylate deaminase
MRLSAKKKMLMGLAANAARQSDEPNRHGCVIARRGQIMAVGFNKPKTHPAAVKYYSGHIHAELAAIIQVNKDDLRGADLYSVRIMRSKGEPRGMGKPCRRCMEMIRDAGIKRIYFTNAEGNTEIIKV